MLGFNFEEVTCVLDMNSKRRSFGQPPDVRCVPTLAYAWIDANHKIVTIIKVTGVQSM